MTGRTNAGNGGGASLIVVGGTTRPVNPLNNTIWVDTDQDITEWAVGSKYPESPLAGTVFIQTNLTASQATIELLKHHSIKIDPAFAFQYIDNAWVTKDMKFYINGAWIDAAAVLYDRGTYGPNFTHGWSQGEQSNWVEISNGAVPAKLATSTGTVDLTGIKTVQIEWAGSATRAQDYDWGSTIAVQIINASTSEVLVQEAHNSVYATSVTTWNANVSAINTTVKFQLRATGGNGTGTVTLYSIKLIPG